MGELRRVYQAQVLDHYKHPRNKGPLDDATFRATERNTLCGDQVTLYVRTDGHDRIEAAHFDGQGCAISLASASILTTMLEGKTLADASALKDAAVLDATGVPPDSARKECALLPILALRSALGASPKAS